MAYKHHIDVIKYYRKWRKINRNKLNEKARKRYRKNPNKEMKRHYEWTVKNRVHLRRYGKLHRIKHKDIINKAARVWRAKVKHEVFQHYGGYKCVCCKETNKGFLTIDHIRKSGKSQYERKQLYVWIKSKGFPKGFRVLCFNCNLGRDKNNGVCPHLNVKE